MYLKYQRISEPITMSIEKKLKERYKQLKEIVDKLTKPQNKKLTPQPALQPYRVRQRFFEG
ncbi:MAG: hypothetical protein ABI480_19095, partial [Chitinophagaceae bacterium]